MKNPIFYLSLFFFSGVIVSALYDSITLFLITFPLFIVFSFTFLISVKQNNLKPKGYEN